MSNADELDAAPLMAAEIAPDRSIPLAERLGSQYAALQMANLRGDTHARDVAEFWLHQIAGENWPELIAAARAHRSAEADERHLRALLSQAHCYVTSPAWDEEGELTQKIEEVLIEASHDAALSTSKEATP